MMGRYDSFSRNTDPYSYFSSEVSLNNPPQQPNESPPNDPEPLGDLDFGVQLWKDLDDDPPFPPSLEGENTSLAEKYRTESDWGFNSSLEGEATLLARKSRAENDWGLNSSSGSNWSGISIPLPGHWSQSGNLNPGLESYDNLTACGPATSGPSFNNSGASAITRVSENPILIVDHLDVDWHGLDRRKSVETGNAQADKRKAQLSPNLSDKSISSGTDGDEVFSAESNGEERKSESVQLNAKGHQSYCQLPEIGMPFSSEEAAYEYYKSYASQIGFKVRKAKLYWRADGTVSKRDFYCSKQGFRSKKQSGKTTKYKRKETRTGCEAMIQLIVEEEQWVISKVILEHNHHLESSSGSHATYPGENFSHTLSVQIKNLFETTEEVVTAKCVGFGRLDEGDCNYLKDRKLNKLQPEDIQGLINYLSDWQLDDPSFFYTGQVDAAKSLTNFFWRDGRSKMDYDYFGDLLLLDTSFKTDKHGMICAPFLGLNHHQQYVLFGCAFLLDETTDSFAWLLGSFMKAMGRGQPKTIFTDQGEAMADAIRMVLPETQHCVGTWYVCQNAEKNLSEHYMQPGFKTLFNKCIYDCQSREEFETAWDSLVKKYKLCKNSWVETLYNSRNKWSQIFVEKTFSGGMESIQGTDNIISVFGSMKSETVTLPELVQKYKKSAENLRKEEHSEDCRCKESVPVMILKSNVEKQAADAYTCKMFTTFQEELRKCLSVAIEETFRDGMMAKFKLLEEGDNQEYAVTFDASDFTINCTCKKFESIGILCVHALKVLNWKNIFHIPQKYILKRWRKDAKDKVVTDDHGKESSEKHIVPLSSCAGELKMKALNIIDKVSANKECLKDVETCLDKAAKEVVEYVHNINPAKNLNTKNVLAGDAIGRKVPKPKKVKIHIKKTQTQMTRQKDMRKVESKSEDATTNQHPQEEASKAIIHCQQILRFNLEEST